MVDPNYLSKASNIYDFVEKAGYGTYSDSTARQLAQALNYTQTPGKDFDPTNTNLNSFFEYLKQQPINDVISKLPQTNDVQAVNQGYWSYADQQQDLANSNAKALSRSSPDGIKNLPTSSPLPTVPTNLSSLEAQYQKLLSPTVDETQSSQDINNLISSRDLGIESIRNKLVPMKFIAGESDALARQAAVKLQPLQQRLATLQAQRQSALDASRFSLERADRQAEITREQARYQSEVAREDARYQQQLATQKQNNSLANGLPFYKYPGSAQTFNAKTNKPISYEEYKALGGIGQPGMDVWGDIYEIGSTSGSSKLLSVTEAARLGVPYGTTQEEAAALSRTPSFGKASSGRSTSTSTTNSSNISGKVNEQNVEEYIRYVASDSGGVTDQNRYDLWGQVADEIKASGVDPTKFDYILWKYFHPEGTKGYKTYKLGQ